MLPLLRCLLVLGLNTSMILELRTGRMKKILMWAGILAGMLTYRIVKGFMAY